MMCPMDGDRFISDIMGHVAANTISNAPRDYRHALLRWNRSGARSSARKGRRCLPRYRRVRIRRHIIGRCCAPVRIGLPRLAPSSINRADFPISGKSGRGGMKRSLKHRLRRTGPRVRISFPPSGESPTNRAQRVPSEGRRLSDTGANAQDALACRVTAVTNLLPIAIGLQFCPSSLLASQAAFNSRHQGAYDDELAGISTSRGRLGRRLFDRSCRHIADSVRRSRGDAARSRHLKSGCVCDCSPKADVVGWRIALCTARRRVSAKGSSNGATPASRPRSWCHSRPTAVR